MCNVAGIADAAMLADVTTEHYNKLIEVDLRGVFHGIKQGIRVMLEAGNGGAIVNWASLAGLNAAPFTSVYSAAKAGVISFTKAAAVEYAAEGIRTNCLCPGFIYTAMSAGRREHPRHAREVADEPRRTGARSRRSRRVPRLRPRVVPQRRHHPGRRRVGREARVTQPPVAGAGRYVGARVQRVEDTRLLTGHGVFVDDVALPGLLHAYFIRSPFARATLGAIDTTKALALPGVHFVFTAADLNPGAKEQWHTATGPLSPETPRPPLAEGEVRFVGDPVALIVADSRGIAMDAAELVDVEYDPLAPVVDYATAEHADVLVHASHGSNVIGEINGLPASALDDVFDAAAHVVSTTISQQAYVPAPMEGRGLLVDYSAPRAT